MSWYLKYQEEVWIKKFQARFWSKSSQRFEDPEDACAAAISHLIMTKLPAVKLKNRDNLDGFVLGVFDCVVTDIARQQSGRLHVPSLLKKKGGAYLKIFFEYCIENNPVEVIAEKLKLPEISVSELVTWLRTNKKCPEKRRKISLSDESNAASVLKHEALIDTSTDPIEQQIESSDSELVSLIVRWFTENPGADEDTPDAQSRLAAKLSTMAKPPISSDDHLLLKLFYWEGLSISATARTLRVSRKKAQKQHDDILQRLQSFFQQHGITN